MKESLIFAFLISLPLCGIMAVLIQDLVGAVLVLSCYSFFLAVLWSLLGAVDVAFTEMVVGAGLSTLFLLATLFRTDKRAHGALLMPNQGWTLAVLLMLAGLLGYGALDLAPIGDMKSPPNTHISPDYLERSMEDTHTPNVVTSVLADYRGFDTLIETTVIFTAGVACLLILGSRRKRFPREAR